MQAVGGTAFVAELAVVVVLDDDRPEFPRPFQQGQTARRAHGHAEGELVRRGDIDQSCAFGNQVHPQALVVHRNPHHPCALGGKQQARRRVAGVFHHHRATRFHQHPGDQVEGLLRAIGHQQVVTVAAHATGETDMPGNGFTEHRQAFRLAVQTSGLRALAQGEQHAAAPFFLGKLMLAGGSAEVVVAQGMGRVMHRHGCVAPMLDHRGPGQFIGLDRLCGVGHVAVDEGAGADPSDQQVVVGEVAVGIGDGLARHPQLFGEQPGRRQACAGGQGAQGNGLAQLFGDLFGQIAAAAEGDVQFHVAARLERAGRIRADGRSLACRRGLRHVGIGIPIFAGIGYLSCGRRGLP